jgi:hypothetical protein
MWTDHLYLSYAFDFYEHLSEFFIRSGPQFLGR